MIITEFLLARLAEDQADCAPMAAAKDDARPGDWAIAYADRVLAECAAKRAVIELYEIHRENLDARRSPRARAAEDERAAQDRRTQEARTRVAEDALLALAAVYKDHPDYRQEWAV